MNYVVSDIHGDQVALTEILMAIDLKSCDHLYVLGDVIDRGPDGIAILQYLMAMPNVTIILGNHEHMFLAAIGEAAFANGKLQFDPSKRYTAAWLGNGGLSTLHELMRLQADPTFSLDVLIGKILALPLAIRVSASGVNYLLTHSTPPGKFTNDKYSCLYKGVRPSDNFGDDQVLVFGHTPTSHYHKAQTEHNKIWFGGDKIGIDCGCGTPSQKACLAALCLDTQEAFYSSTKSK